MRLSSSGTIWISPWQAGGGRRIPQAGRRGSRELRSPQIRCPVGHAFGDSQAVVPRPDLRQASLRGLQGGLPANPGDLRRAHTDHRAVVTGRGLPRRDRKSAEHSVSPGRRVRDPREDQGGNRPQRSAGISYNNFLAKLAADHRKPNGQYIITTETRPALVESLPVGKFHRSGPATSSKMNALGTFASIKWDCDLDVP
jgi:hypothetical protein